MAYNASVSEARSEYGDILQRSCRNGERTNKGLEREAVIGVERVTAIVSRTRSCAK